LLAVVVMAAVVPVAAVATMWFNLAALNSMCCICSGRIGKSPVHVMVARRWWCGELLQPCQCPAASIVLRIVYLQWLQRHTALPCD
jgi:hypothetical protein